MSNSDIDLDEADYMRILDPFCGFVHLMITARMCGILAAESSHQINNEHDFGETLVPFILCLNIESALDLNLKHGQKWNVKKIMFNSCSTVWFRSRALRVMSPARFRCATVLAIANWNPYLWIRTASDTTRQASYATAESAISANYSILHPPCHVLAKIYICTYLCTDTKFNI